MRSNLDCREPARLERARDRVEEGGQMLVAHGFNHLDGDNLVEGSLHLKTEKETLLFKKNRE